MDTHTSRPRPLRQVTATATATVTATGSALAVVLLPVVVGALVARSAGADPMASVNALIAGGGERAKLSRSHLPVLRDMRSAPRRMGARWTRRCPQEGGPAGRQPESRPVDRLSGRLSDRVPSRLPGRRLLLAGREDVRVEVADGGER